MLLTQPILDALAGTAAPAWKAATDSRQRCATDVTMPRQSNYPVPTTELAGGWVLHAGPCWCLHTEATQFLGQGAVGDVLRGYYTLTTEVVTGRSSEGCTGML